MDDETEEFYSFSFIVSSKEGTPPIFISDDNYCLINYKNFPKTITLDTIKVNLKISPPRILKHAAVCIMRDL